MQASLFPNTAPSELPKTTCIVPNRIDLIEHFIPSMETGSFFQRILETTAWREDSVKIGGMSYLVPRLLAWYGDPGITYKYSGIKHEASVWTSALAEVRGRVERLCGIRPNGVLLNYYRDGKDSIGRHSDDERELVPDAPIFGLSLGAVRTMHLRAKGSGNQQKIILSLPNGSLLKMYGDCQSTWTHEIKKEPSVIEPRISLTFRVLSRF